MDILNCLLLVISKTILLLIGLALLFGGGLCVVMDFKYFSSETNFDVFLMTAIAVSVTWVGWKLTKSIISPLIFSSKK